MESNYDMCVDYDTLRYFKKKLSIVDSDICESIKRMQAAIIQSQNFLEGNQFDKAKKNTTTCSGVSAKTSQNIKYAIEYLDSIIELLDEYNECKYNGEN